MFGGHKYIGLLTDLKIGYAPSDKVAIFYTGKQVWYYNRSLFFTEGLPLIGFNLYMKLRSPSTYFTGGVGSSIIAAGAGGDAGAGLVVGGVTLFGGVGEELTRHVNIEFNLAGGVIGSGPGSRLIWTPGIELRLLGY